MRFQINNMDFGLSVDGVNYEFDDIMSWVETDPKRKRLRRGANAKNTTGLVFTEGLSEACTLTITVIGMPSALHNRLIAAHDNEERLKVWGIDRATGSSKNAKEAILSQPPRQLTIDESAESMDVVLEFETFLLKEDHKA